MSESYPRRDQARGIWKINDITKNIKGDGTYPGSIGGDRAIFFGGWAPGGANNNIDFVEITTTGNATDFGDMTSAKYGGSAFSDGVRAGMYGATSPVTAIDYVQVSTTGNAADFGDATVARLYSFGASTKTKGFSAGGRTPSVSNVMEFVTVASVGNGTDFGDLHTAQEKAGSANNHVRALYGGGAAPSTTNAIGFYELSSSGNSFDFGDLTRSDNYMGGTSSNTEAMFAGGDNNVNIIDFVTIASTGNAADFGDLTVGREALGGTGNMQRGLFVGGWDGSAPSNVIDYITFSTRGNAVDFGDLTVARGYGDLATSQSNAGIEEFNPRAPELYSPTGKPLAQSAGVGNIGFLMGGYNPSKTKNIDFIDIATLGNSVQFGDISHDEMTHNAGFSSETRGFSAGGSDAAMSNDIVYIEMKSKGNSADFGDATISYWYTTGASNSTRGLTFGGESPTPGTASNVIQYVTMASIGNATDFGDMTQIRYTPMGTGNSTRGICSGGYATSPTNSVVNTMDYITIGSTGNATDFGDLTQARYDGGAVSSTTRSVIGGGGDAGSTQYNIIDYVTIASTGNATDFGDLTQARSGVAGCTGNSLRALWLGGQSPTRDTMDFVTIASTGNAADFGDLREATYGGSNGTISTGHGGLS